MAGLASEQTLSALTGELLTAAAAMDETALGALAVDLGGAATVIAEEPTVRRMLTESTAEPAARIALARRLFDGKVSERTATLIASAVGQRWSRGSDLVDGLRRLSRTAYFVQAERSGELDEVEDQLFRFGRIVDANPELSLLLDDPATSAAGRVDLVGRLLAGKAHRLTVDLLSDLARDSAGRSFAHGIAELVTQAAQRRDKLVAIVTSAVALSAAEADRLRAALAAIYSRQVAVHVVVDPALRGGLRVRVGDEIIDGSISTRLTALRQRLAR